MEKEEKELASKERHMGEAVSGEEVEKGLERIRLSDKKFWI